MNHRNDYVEGDHACGFYKWKSIQISSGRRALFSCGASGEEKKKKEKKEAPEVTEAPEAPKPGGATRGLVPPTRL